jgi:hypothetical protein
MGRPHETENKVRLGLQGSLDPKKTLQNSITARFTGPLVLEDRAVLLCRIALLRTKIRTFIGEQISLLTVLYFPFRVRTPACPSSLRLPNTADPDLQAWRRRR